MSDLFPTKTRIGLLIDVADGCVITAHGKACYADDGVVVDSRIREMERAGWVEERSGVCYSWVLTEAGEAVLRRAEVQWPELFGPPTIVTYGPVQEPYVFGGGAS